VEHRVERPRPSPRCQHGRGPHGDHGLEFGYHNHNHEFQQLDDADETGYDVFAEAVEDHVHLQLDVGWVETGGANPTEYISRYKDKISSIHMKNMEDGGFVEIDEGDVNMKAVANVALS